MLSGQLEPAAPPSRRVRVSVLKRASIFWSHKVLPAAVLVVEVRAAHEKGFVLSDVVPAARAAIPVAAGAAAAGFGLGHVVAASAPGGDGGGIRILRYCDESEDVDEEERENLVEGHGDFVLVERGIKIIRNRPVIRVIPTRQISDDIICTTATCTIGFAKSVSVSTTHSAEVSLSITAGAKPFGIGMEFTTTVGYGYSNTAEESTTLSYNFDLVRGEAGYIGMANAEVSADVRVSGCRCNSFICSAQCSFSGPTMTDTGHHQAVILKNGIPRGFVSFIFTS
ncbi:MAG: hypothetical protein BYD32DRAFT_461203 [Podila humilis]|nr:MAG: hypothetical protein BYD32DRAFT_461203 [Podila humilis]